ncbi:MAG: methyltransferase domain-containing protein [Nocardioides sp.]
MTTAGTTPPPDGAGDRFDAHLEQWRTWADAPWGRIRFAVVAAVLGRHVDALGERLTRPLRVLDVGGGDGRDAVSLAAAGHRVTLVDTAEGMLAEARRRASEAGAALETVAGSLDDLTAVASGDVDLTLCHFVLQYRPDPARDLSRLVATLRPGGRLSVIAPNPVGRVLMRLTREGPRAALEEQARDDMEAATFGTTVRRLTSAEVVGELVAQGLRVVGSTAGAPPTTC